MKLWLLRHAPVLLAPGLCYGASDVPADEAASREAAQRAADLLPQGLPMRVSGLQRSQQLARHLRILRPDLKVPMVDSRLNEMDFGCWELQPWDAIPRPAFDAWMADFDHHCFGGVESTQAVLARVADALTEEQAAQGAEGQTLWVTHAGVIRAVQHLAAHGLRPVGDAACWPRTVVPPGGLQRVVLGPCVGWGA